MNEVNASVDRLVTLGGYTKDDECTFCLEYPRLTKAVMIEGEHEVSLCLACRTSYENRRDHYSAWMHGVCIPNDGVWNGEQIIHKKRA